MNFKSWLSQCDVTAIKVMHKIYLEISSEVSIYLANIFSINSDLVNNDTWSYISTITLYEFSKWRFPNPNIQRLRGGERNVFQRLWKRAIQLDMGIDNEDRWKFVRSLTEDAFVQIFERPFLGRDSNIAKSIAYTWCIKKDKTQLPIESVMRKAMLFLMQKSMIQDIFFLDQKSLNSVISECFDQAEEVLQVTRMDMS